MIKNISKNIVFNNIQYFFCSKIELYIGGKYKVIKIKNKLNKIKNKIIKY